MQVVGAAGGVDEGAVEVGGLQGAQEQAEAGVERAVCDYLAGMTDRYAEREHLRLVGPLPQ